VLQQQLIFTIIIHYMYTAHALLLYNYYLLPLQTTSPPLRLKFCGQHRYYQFPRTSPSQFNNRDRRIARVPPEPIANKNHYIYVLSSSASRIFLIRRRNTLLYCNSALLQWRIRCVPTDLCDRRETFTTIVIAVATKSTSPRCLLSMNDFWST